MAVNIAESTGVGVDVVEQLRSLAERYGLASVILFGSRARGDYGQRSDIDLALSGGDQVRFALDVEEDVPTLLSFDFVNIDLAGEELREVVEREGIVLYEEA